MMANWIKYKDSIVNLDKVSYINFDNEELMIYFNFDYDNYAEFDFKTKEAYNDYIEILMVNEMGFAKRGKN